MNFIVSTEDKMFLYRVMVRSVLTYACPVWTMICRSNFNKLQVVQNKFLRLIGKYRKWSLINTMHDGLKIERIEVYIIQMTRNYFEKLNIM